MHEILQGDNVLKTIRLLYPLEGNGKLGKLEPFVLGFGIKKQDR